MSLEEQQTKRRGPGRPRKANVDAGEPVRPSRRKKAGWEGGPLDVAGKDPDFVYHWVLGKSEDDANIFKALQNDWEFVTTDEELLVGPDTVHKSENIGSVYRVPAGRNDPGNYLYLMKIRKEYYDEDTAEVQDKVDRREAGLFRANKGAGQYGKVQYED